MSNPHKPWLDKAKQNKKFYGTKGLSEKANEQKSSSNVTSTNKEKPSCIKPWLEKAAEKKGKRGLSSSSQSKTSRLQTRMSDGTVQNPNSSFYTIAAQYKKQIENSKRFSIAELRQKPIKHSWGSLNRYGNKAVPKTYKKNISSKSLTGEPSMPATTGSRSFSPQAKISALKPSVQFDPSETKSSETKPIEIQPEDDTVEYKPSDSKMPETDEESVNTLLEIQEEPKPKAMQVLTVLCIMLALFKD